MKKNDFFNIILIEIISFSLKMLFSDALSRFAGGDPKTLTSRWNEMVENPERINEEFEILHEEREVWVRKMQEQIGGSLIKNEDPAEQIDSSVHTLDKTRAGPASNFAWFDELIMAQAPLRNRGFDTVIGFLEMIEVNNVTQVVQLAAMAQKIETPTVQYYAPLVTNFKRFGKYELITLAVHTCGNMEFRILKLVNKETDTISVIRHFYFRGIEDRSVPSDLDEFIRFVRLLFRLLFEYHDGKTLVHCTAGVGRAGIFAVIFAFIWLIKNCDIYGDVPKILGHIRTGRIDAVQTASQYSFIYKACLRCINMTDDFCNSLIAEYNKKIEESRESAAPRIEKYEADRARRDRGKDEKKNNLETVVEVDANYFMKMLGCT